MTKKITVQEEGVTISEGVRVLNFIGAGATASGDGSIADIAIPGGGGGSPALPPTDIYVSTNDGDDGNDGLTPVTAFATITKAINTVGEAAPANYAPIIHIASGTYNAQQLQGVTWPALTRESSGIIFWGDGGGQPGDDGCTVLQTGTITGMGDYIGFWGSNNVVAVDFTFDTDNIGYTLEITSGANAGQRRTIVAGDSSEIKLSYGFDSNQVSGNCRVFRPGVILDETVYDGDYRRQFRMMPLASAGGFAPNLELVTFSEPLPSSPTTVWANIELANSIASSYSAFIFEGGQVALFGVVLGVDALARLDLSSLFIGASKGLIPQNNTIVFEPAPALQPLKDAVSNIVKKWNGWGYSGSFECVNVSRMYTLAWYLNDDVELQGLRVSDLYGMHGGPSNQVELHNCVVYLSDCYAQDITVSTHSIVKLSSTVFVEQVTAELGSLLETEAVCTDPGLVAKAYTGSKIQIAMAGLSATQEVGVLGNGSSAIAVGNDVAPGTPVLTVATLQQLSYFTDVGMAIMGADGSMITATSVLPP